MPLALVGILCTPCNLFQLNGNNPFTDTFGIQGDIYNICQYG